MSPLLQLLVREAMALPDKDEVDHALQYFCSASAFELSDVAEQMDAIVRRVPAGAFSAHFFLPHPVTWVEWLRPTDGDRNRDGFIAREISSPGGVGRGAIDLIGFAAEGDIILDEFYCGVGRMRDGGFSFVLPGAARDADRRKAGAWWGACVAALSIIHAPRAFDRVAVETHRGLGRALRRAGVRDPLKPWSRIVLDGSVSAPGSQDRAPRLADVRVGRAWHLCRAHPRFRLGKWERVPQHERGNPAFGARPTPPDYKVLP